jgi:sulfate adenylyltransferase
VTGSAAGWLELQLTGGGSGRILDPDSAAAARRTWTLPDGTVCPLPSELAVDPAVAAQARAAGAARLTDSEGVPLADLLVEGTSATAGRDRLCLLWGRLRPLDHPVHHDHLTLRRPPAQLREQGPWAALWVDPPPSAGLRRAAAREAARAGLPLLHVATLDPARSTSTPAHLGARLARRLQDVGHHVVLLPVPDLGWEPAEVLARAVVAASCGVRLLLVEAGRLSGDDAARVRKLAAGCGVDLVELPPETVAADAGELLRRVDAGADIPADVLEPEMVAEVAAVHRPLWRQGYTVFFTGLSGSGKSTVAARLVARLLERETRSVTLLDGDAVRLHLSKGLGFSREDRETNVRRLGFVSAEVTKAGGVAVCCPIAPEDTVRKAVRAMVEPHGTFVLVHVATPLEECERRDRKGLYARARAGLVPEFTGISSPYEAPTDAELVVDTTGADLDDCVQRVLDHLGSAGLLPAEPARRAEPVRASSRTSSSR